MSSVPAPLSHRVGQQSFSSLPTVRVFHMSLIDCNMLTAIFRTEVFEHDKLVGLKKWDRSDQQTVQFLECTLPRPRTRAYANGSSACEGCRDLWRVLRVSESFAYPGRCRRMFRFCAWGSDFAILISRFEPDPDFVIFQDSCWQSSSSSFT